MNDVIGEIKEIIFTSLPSEAERQMGGPSMSADTSK